MINLQVPYSDNEMVKKLGARWSQNHKAWQIPDDADIAKFSRWLIVPENKRKAKPGRLLTIELVPTTCWFSNVRNHVPKETWDLIKRATFRTAGYKCEICNGVGPEHPVECHEIWLYDDKALVQTLEGCIALCPRCHEVKHFGFANMNGRHGEALQWLKQINGWSENQTEQYIHDQFSIWEHRSLREWKLNLSWLESTYGIKVEEER